MLPPQGIGVARFDRRGDDVPLADQANDALAVVRELRAHPRIDARRIGLWGFSQGAWVAPLAAAESGDIAFLVLVASTGVTPVAQMRYGTAKQARDAGVSEPDVARLLDVRRTFEAYARGERSRAEAQALVDRVRDEPWFARAWMRATLPPEPGFWPDMDFDPEMTFARVRVPVLLFYGEDDEWQPTDASIEAWERAAARGHTDLTVVRLPGVGHAPSTADDVAAVSPRYTQTLLEWLARVAGPPRL